MAKRKNCQKIGQQGWFQDYPKTVLLVNVTTERDLPIICHKQSKVFSKVILNKLSITVDQGSFRKGRSCSDHIFTLQHRLEQCQERNAPVYASFIDFEKVLDSITPSGVYWGIMVSQSRLWVSLNCCIVMPNPESSVGTTFQRSSRLNLVLNKGVQSVHFYSENL